ncbi:protein phosphatase 2C domain-containing protein [Streptomyces sp. BP-8]|uniref:Protein phosphatase 2C domain-containing protein n=1 Tax=Streptomyces sirii TaxID=3127701 RepID=A0ABZ2QUM9_9ACTN
MNQQGARRGQEDDWWRQLYGEGGGEAAVGDAPERGAVRDAGPADASDTLDDRVESALRAVGAPEWAVPPARAEPPARKLPPPPEPAAPIPLRATGPGSRPPAPTWGMPSSPAAEPVALPAADPDALDELVPDTVLDGARYGSLTLRAASQRGASARYRGEARRDALLTARFGTGRHTLILVAVATGLPAVEGAHRAAQDACAWIGGAVGRSCTRLAQDIRTDHRDALVSGLQRLTDRTYGKLRARALDRGAAPENYTAALRCLLLPADPDCRTRVFFGVGAGGLFRLRDGAWQDLEPAATHQPEPFRFRAECGRPGDTLLLCSTGLAEPLQQEPDFAARLAAQWSAPEPPGLVPFLTTTAQLRAQGHTKDRTAVGVWES